MKAIVVVSAVALILLACSPNHTEGCWITHSSGVKLDQQVQFPINGDALAMNPDQSYRIWCARNIDKSNVGDIISEDQRTLRIVDLPHDTQLQIYPNERNRMYRGQPVRSSENLWKSFEEASSERLTSYWIVAVVSTLIIIVIAVGALSAKYILRRQRYDQDDAPNTELRF